MKPYLPEGMAIHTHRLYPDDLRRAMAEGTILQGIALQCSERHALLVDLGGILAYIPREEAALGIREGTVRDIAILSRVGKPVCCKVCSVDADGTVLCSRRAAQEQALNDMIVHLQPGDVLPAIVTSLADFGAFCDIGCGVTALLGIAGISISRITHSRDRFTVGQRIFVAIRSIDPKAKRITLTHRELLGTWEENAALFRAGQTVTGIVRSVRDYGAFVELTPNFSGLAEPADGLIPGDAVSVYIKSIQPEKRKCKLAVISHLDHAPQQPLRYFITQGHLDHWAYAPGKATFPA